MDSSISRTDEIWFMRVWYLILTAVYLQREIVTIRFQNAKWEGKLSVIMRTDLVRVFIQESLLVNKTTRHSGLVAH
jgi:hypothetical protein